MKVEANSLISSLLLIISLSLYSVESRSTNSTHSQTGHNEFRFETDSPVYVVGDIHGAYTAVVKTLKNSKLIDSNNQWIGGSAHFVSVGDLMDRGPASRKVMDLFIQLQQQADSAGGKFHVILGNHEVMNLVGDLRYLSKEEISEFASDETPQQREKAYKKYRRASGLRHSEDVLLKFDSEYTPGFFARQQAFSKTGKYGQWLLSLPFVIQINDQLFAHGGLSKIAATYTLADFNTESKKGLITYLNRWQALVKKIGVSALIPYKQRVSFVNKLKASKQKKQFLNAEKHFILSSQGPTWYRGNAQCHPYFEKEILADTLSNWNAKHLWVGHTTSRTKNPLTRLDGMLTIMDTGMLTSHYKGAPWISRFSKTEDPIFTHGLTGEVRKPDLSPNREWSNPYNLTDRQVEDFLRTASVKKIGNTKEGKTRPFKVELTKEGKTIKGIFKYHDKGTHSSSKKNKYLSDRYQYEMAAYKLDRLLGVGLVPVTVERKVNGQGGIIQVWVDGLISKLEMADNKIPYKGYCDELSQEIFLNTFDYLIANRDRNQSNVLYTREDMQIWFIDHSRSFGIKAHVPKLLRKLKIEATDRFKEELKKLDAKKLEILKPWLQGRQIHGLLRRRDKIISGEI